LDSIAWQVLTLMRVVHTVPGALPQAMRTSVLHSRGLLGDLALEFARRAARLHTTTSSTATAIERDARERLSVAAKSSTDSLEDAKAFWEKGSVVADAATVERCITDRMCERVGQPPTKLLKKLMARAMVAKTKEELLRTMAAVAAATGAANLATEIATESMNSVLQLRLPTELPSSHGDPAAVAQLQVDLVGAGLPEEVVTAAFPAGGAENIDSATITTWLAVLLTMEQCGQLLSQTRERKVLVHGGDEKTESPRSVGGVGSQRRVSAFKEVGVRLKTKKAELWRWFREHNVLAAALQQAKLQVDGRATRSSLLPAPLKKLLERVPPVMTKEQLLDPAWLPDTDGVSRTLTADTAFVDALRRLRTHTQEATRLAVINAEALLAAIVGARSDIARRITKGLTPVLDAGEEGPDADSLRTASWCSGKDLAVARHFQQSVLPPQVWLHMTLSDQTGTPTLDNRALLVLKGWRAFLRNKLDQASMLLNDAVATLQGVLPASCTEATTVPPAVAQMPPPVAMVIQSEGMDVPPAAIANIVASLLDNLPLPTQTAAAATTDDDAARTSSGNDESDEDLDEEDQSDA